MQDNGSDHDLLIRLETKVDNFIGAQTDHEIRLRLVEANREQMEGAIKSLKGIVALIGVVATIAGALGTWALLIKP